LWPSTQPKQTRREEVAVQAAARAVAKHSAANTGLQGLLICQFVSRWWRTALIVLLNFTLSTAQDMHFTQVPMSAWQINPAAQVLMPEQTRATLQHRSQWLSVPVAYTTSALTVERKWHAGKKAGWGSGLTMVSDRAGDGLLFNRAIAATVGYSQTLTSKFELAAAFQPRLGSRGVDINRLSFGEQYTGELYDPSLPTGEPDAAWRVGYFSMGGGAALRYRNTGLIKLAEIGVAGYHLNTPQAGFRNDVTGNLQRRTNMYVSVVGQGGAHGEWIALLLWQQQGVSVETLPMLGYRYHVPGLQKWSPVVSFETGTRLGDAVFGVFSLQFAGFTWSYSYDINTSAFETATNRRGGSEFALRYQVTPVLAPKTIKVCPVF
jgi:type IX secretion system PorP/SprF family membrane protein